MENFFNYIAKPMTQEDVDIWFKINNIIPEKLELYYDFSHSLYDLILTTYLGDDDISDTRVNITEEDKVNHFDWCWNQTLDNFNKEEIFFSKRGDHYDYFLSFYTDIFYNQKESKIKGSIGTFFKDLFDRNKAFTKSDLDMILAIYKSLDKNMSL